MCFLKIIFSESLQKMFHTFMADSYKVYLSDVNADIHSTVQILSASDIHYFLSREFQFLQ